MTSLKKLFIAFIFIFSGPAITAQNLHLVKDIDNMKDGTPTNVYFDKSGSSKGAYAVLDNVSYFGANDGLHGLELWRSDGTDTGTYLVKDIRPGIEGSGINEVTVCKNKIYFTADDGTHGIELWESDGTTDSTIMVKDIYAGSNSSNPYYLIPAANILFFSASDADGGNELWKTDGTDSGTTIVKDIEPGANGSYPGHFAILNGFLCFTRYTNTGQQELWKSDGTDTGTTLVKNIGNTGINSIISIGKKLFFGDNNGNLWVSDGTDSGTSIVKNFTSSGPGLYDLIAFHNIVYFTAVNQINGEELWRSNGTTLGTYSIKDITPGVDYQNSVVGKTVVGNQIFFFGANGNGNYDLWKTDGSTLGTVLVKSFGSQPGGLTYVNGTLYFGVYTSATGNELWKSDGTHDGTVMIKDIYKGVPSSNAGYFTAMQGFVLFVATDGRHGYELWKTDSTVAGTVMIKDINTSTTNNSYTGGFTDLNGTVYFSAMNDKYGYELWKTNGTEATTSIVKNIGEGSLSGIYEFQTPPVKSGNNIYFYGHNEKTGTEVWKSDGTIKGTKLADDITPGRQGFGGFILNAMVDVNGKLFFITPKSIYANGSYSVYANINDLWETNGKPSGTHLVRTTSMYFDNLTPLGNELFFTESYNSLWKTNGVDTQKISNAHLAYYTYPFADSNAVYFQANDNTMWRTDGTELGTYSLKNIIPRPFIYNVNLHKTYALLNHKLIFPASDTANGLELWQTDGTTSGTKLIKDISTGSASSQFDFFTPVDSLIYFVANDNIHGNELWKTNGTQAGTRLVKDITPGISSTTFWSMVRVGNKVCFLVSNPSGSTFTLWESDGTKAGTKPVGDSSLIPVTFNYYSSLYALGDTLYFSAYTNENNLELWSGTLGNNFAKVQVSFTGKVIANDGELNWSVNTEENFDYYNLQRSIDGLHFKTIAKMDANNTVRNGYQYFDRGLTSLGKSNIYYRLELIDKDSKNSFSKIVELNLNKNNSIKIYPNPVKDVLSIYGLNASVNNIISIITTDGKTIDKKNIKGNTFNLNINTLPSGNYYVRIKEDKKVTTLKFIKQ